MTPEMRGKGIGKALLGGLEDPARLAGGGLQREQGGRALVAAGLPAGPLGIERFGDDD